MKYLNTYHEHTVNEGVKNWISSFALLTSLGLVPPKVASSQNQQVKKEFVDRYIKDNPKLANNLPDSIKKAVRTDEMRPEISQPISLAKKADLWVFYPGSGKWNKNTDKDTILCGLEKMVRDKGMEVRTINVDNKKYYILSFYVKVTGRPDPYTTYHDYEPLVIGNKVYPGRGQSIIGGGFVFHSYIFTEQEFHKLKEDGGEITTSIEKTISNDDSISLRDNVFKAIKEKKDKPSLKEWKRQMRYRYGSVPKFMSPNDDDIKFSIIRVDKSIYRFIPTIYHFEKEWGYDKKYFEVDSEELRLFLKNIPL